MKGRAENHYKATEQHRTSSKTLFDSQCVISLNYYSQNKEGQCRLTEDFEVTSGSTGTQHTPKLGKTSQFVPKAGRRTFRDTS